MSPPVPGTMLIGLEANYEKFDNRRENRLGLLYNRQSAARWDVSAAFEAGARSRT